MQESQEHLESIANKILNHEEQLSIVQNKFMRECNIYDQKLNELNELERRIKEKIKVEQSLIENISKSQTERENLQNNIKFLREQDRISVIFFLYYFSIQFCIRIIFLILFYLNYN